MLLAGMANSLPTGLSRDTNIPMCEDEYPYRAQRSSKISITQNGRGIAVRLCRFFDFAPLPLPLLRHSLHLVLHEHLCEALGELKQAPHLEGGLLRSVPVDSQPGGPHGPYERTFPPVCSLGDLHAPPMESPCARFYRQCPTPSYSSVAANRARTGLPERGHDARDPLRPVGAPLFRADDRAIAPVRQHGVTLQGPIIVPCALGGRMGRHPAPMCPGSLCACAASHSPRATGGLR